MSYDVLAARAARLAETGADEWWTFTVGADEFHLPTETPADVLAPLAGLAPLIDGSDPEDQDPALMAAAAASFPRIMRELLGAEDAERLARHRLSIQDLAALIGAYFEQTGSGLGEPSPPPMPSPSTPRRSKRTSRGTTA